MVSLICKQRLVSIDKISDRLMTIKLVINKELWNIISPYASQQGCESAEKEKFWLDLEALINKIPDDEQVLLAGDLNGHVGSLNGGEKRWHGGFGLGVRNAPGEEIMTCAKAHNLVILNTCFRKDDEHLVTYSSGGNETQIDYHMCSSRLKKRAKDCKVIIGEPLTTQHRLLLTEFRVQDPGRKKDTAVRVEKIKWFKLKEPESESYRSMMNELLEDCVAAVEDQVKQEDNMTADEIWDAFMDGCKLKAREHLGVSKGRLHIGKEAWFWNDDVKTAVKLKKEAFQDWKKSDTTDENEINRLKDDYHSKRKLAAKAVAQARAKACSSMYDDLETPEGQQRLFKIAAQRRNNAKAITAPKFILHHTAGRLLTQDNEITEGWQSYFHKLLNEEFPRTEILTLPPVSGPVEAITYIEVKKAIDLMKGGKAVGPDEIPTELWKVCNDSGIHFLEVLFNKILNGDRMPNAFRESFLLPFYKNKVDSRICGNYRGIKLTPHTLKIWERVVAERLLNIVLPQIHGAQCGFLPGKSTTDAIQSLRIMVEKHRDAKHDLHMIFIDLEKAFDRVPRDLIWTALRHHGVPELYINLIQDMYSDATTKVRCTAGSSMPFPVKVGVHQGSVLSPLLFVIIMNFLTAGLSNLLLLTLLFADDVVLASDDVMALQQVFNDWQKILEENGMKISRTKTEQLSCMFSDPGAPTPDIQLDGQALPKC